MQWYLSTQTFENSVLNWVQCNVIEDRAQSFCARSSDSPPTDWMLGARQLLLDFSRISLHERTEERLSFLHSAKYPQKHLSPRGRVISPSSLTSHSQSPKRDTWTRVFHQGRGHYWMEGQRVISPLPPTSADRYHCDLMTFAQWQMTGVRERAAEEKVEKN